MFISVVVVRQMSGGGHKRVMDIKPSNYEWKRYADHFVRAVLRILE